jgi:hypothetical protein
MKHKATDKATLLAIIDDIRASIAADDSFEGSIEYLMPEPLGLDANADFAVRASYRVGNSMGQGGSCMYGTMESAGEPT